ncbi:DUF6694 family lipoprotein [Pectobacterium carotovorum]|uniref:DUF6694 family lipoprotein n=1 Tax=Pectobacterium carotovorum TaxID=554 RepID=UPI003017F971
MKEAMVALAIILSLSGCDKPKIDTSSDEEMKSSIQKVRTSLPDNQRPAYDDALKVVALSHLNLAELMQTGIANNTSAIEAQMKNDISGKTGEEIISYADKIRKERAERQKLQVRQEIAELEQKQKTAEVSLKLLEAFKVARPRFYFEKKEYGKDQPIISLSVENGTTKAVSRAYFKGVIASPGREVPWFTDTFSYQISGGLEPGEKADWNLAPNPYSNWGNAAAPADAVFTITVIRIDDAQGNPVFGDSEFTERDADRLAEIRAKFTNTMP